MCLIVAPGAQTHTPATSLGFTCGLHTPKLLQVHGLFHQNPRSVFGTRYAMLACVVRGRERSEEMKARTILNQIILLGAAALLSQPVVPEAEAGRRGRQEHRPVVRELERSKHVCSKKYRKKRGKKQCRWQKQRWRGGAAYAGPPAWRRGCDVWYAGAERAWYRGTPYFLHGRTGIYLGGLALEFEIGRELPYGYMVMHAATGRTFDSFRSAKRWCKRHPRHRPYFTVVEVRRRGCY